jgi:3-oxoacyl-[acyl-carrier protein] reductase
LALICIFDHIDGSAEAWLALVVVTFGEGAAHVNPTALISGGTSGIGLATAQRLAAAGYQIAICGRDRGRLAAAERAIRASDPGIAVELCQVDFQQPQTVASAVQQTLNAFGRIDVLVNAAAVAPMGAFESFTAEQVDELMNVNHRSLLAMTQAVWKPMQTQGVGVIVNISSIAAVDPFPGFTIYGASKAWLDALTHSLAAEGKSYGIRVFSVRPGAVDTPMLRGLFPKFPADQTVAPADVAAVIESLLSPSWRYSSGQIVHVTRQ